MSSARFARAVIVLAVAGCVRADARQVTMADGTADWTIECPNDQRDCVTKADAECPHGYLTIGEPEHRGSLTIRCR
jgi:hypothetical protein